MRRSRARAAAFTLVELMIVVALVAIIAALAAPSLRDMILVQRLRSINAQLVTDLAFARSEAVSRGVFVGVNIPPPSGGTCYILYTRVSLGTTPCDCTRTTRCPDAGTTEIRTVQIPSDLSVTVQKLASQVAYDFTFDPRTGGMKLAASDLGIYDTSGFQVVSAIDPARALQTSVSLAGRVTVCTPSLSQLGGSAC